MFWIVIPNDERSGIWLSNQGAPSTLVLVSHHAVALNSYKWAYNDIELIALVIRIIIPFITKLLIIYNRAILG
jgi:hypothetical protein